MLKRPLLRASLVLLLAAFTGCGVLAKAVPKRQRPPRATAIAPPQLIGTISLINEGSRFALIDNGDLSAPETGAVVQSYRGSERTGELVITQVRRRPFLIADIRQGAPAKGDRVVLPPAEKREIVGAKPTPVPSMDNAPMARAEAVAPAPKKKRWWTLGLF